MTEQQRAMFTRTVADETMQPSAEEIERIEQKRRRLESEKRWMEETAEENRQKSAELKREKAESDFRSNLQAVFFEQNPNAELKDFLRLYSKLRDDVMIDRLKRGLLSKKGLLDVAEFS